MRKIMCVFLVAVLCSMTLSGCGYFWARLAATQATPPETTAATTAVPEITVPETTAPTQEETTAPTEEETTAPTEPLSDTLPYLKSLPAEACIFKEPDADSAFSQTVEQEGIYTIVEEVRHANGQIWGRLKSGVGWVNLSDPFCHGKALPAVTASRTSQIIMDSQHHRVNAQASQEYVIYLTFMPHETVYNLRLEEQHPVWSKTLATIDTLSPGMPLVVGVTLVDFNYFTLTYEYGDGQTGSVCVDQNYTDGPLLYFSYSN